jgi:glycine cleavage system H protein
MATIGITDYAQESLGEILSVEFTEIDIYVERDETFGSIESTKTVVDLISPISGTVVNINEDIKDDIGIINSDPHDMGWLVVIEMDDLEQLEDLLVATAYHDFIMQEEESD